MARGSVSQMSTVDVSLDVRTGEVRVWASVTEGFYDPGRFPERMLLHCTGGEANTESVELKSGQALVLRVEDDTRATPSYSLRADLGPLHLLEVVARPYEHGERVGVAEHVRHRLTSVKPIARIRGYKVLPEKVSETERIIEFKPSIPAGAKWL